LSQSWCLVVGIFQWHFGSLYITITIIIVLLFWKNSGTRTYCEWIFWKLFVICFVRYYSSDSIDDVNSGFESKKTVNYLEQAIHNLCEFFKVGLLWYPFWLFNVHDIKYFYLFSTTVYKIMFNNLFIKKCFVFSDSFLTVSLTNINWMQRNHKMSNLLRTHATFCWLFSLLHVTFIY